MSAPKFTQGWWVGVNGHDADMIEDSGEWAPVIDGTHDDGGVVAWVHPAHASKVAAAPELYEALEMLVRFHESEPQPGLSSWHEWLARSLEQARSALGKAGGE